MGLPWAHAPPGGVTGSPPTGHCLGHAEAGPGGPGGMGGPAAARRCRGPGEAGLAASLQDRCGDGGALGRPAGAGALWVGPDRDVGMTPASGWRRGTDTDVREAGHFRRELRAGGRAAARGKCVWGREAAPAGSGSGVGGPGASRLRTRDPSRRAGPGAGRGSVSSPGIATHFLDAAGAVAPVPQTPRQPVRARLWVPHPGRRPPPQASEKPRKA